MNHEYNMLLLERYGERAVVVTKEQIKQIEERAVEQWKTEHQISAMISDLPVWVKVFAAILGAAWFVFNFTNV